MAVTTTNAGMTVAMTAASDEITTPIKGRLRWVSKAAVAGDDIAVHESSTGDTGKVVWVSVANGANYVEESLDAQDFPFGVRVDTIDSGTLYVYLVRGD